MQEWDDLRYFLAVAQTGSVTAASVKLGVNQSTVSRRINNFEKLMNVRLFERLSTGYELTPEGEELRHRVLHIEDEIHAIDRHIMGKNIALSGPIRVATSLAMARYFVLPIFKRFNKLHPGIELHLNLIGRELGLVDYGVYGEKRYVESYTKAKGKIPLRWIGEDNNDSRPNWLPGGIEPIQLVMRCNEVLATMDAIQQGLGVGRLPAFIGDANSKLKQLKFSQKITSVPVWLLSHEDMRRVNRMRVFTSFLVEEMRGLLNYSH